MPLVTQRLIAEARPMTGGTHTVTLHIPEAKSQLHVAMRNWPAADDSTELFLQQLHWRIRRVVIMTHGEELTQEQIAARLRISVDTVQTDLKRAYDVFEEMFRGQFS
jgi:DNA-directed RNA polymerase specialized sigma24 family protein